MAKKAIIYCRVACESQEKNYDPFNHQLDTCKEYADKNGYEVIKVVAEYGSGARVNDGLKEAMELIRVGEAGILITSTIDRISRNYQIFIKTMTRIELFGGVVKLANEANGAASLLIKNIMQGVASYYSFQHGQLIKKGLAAKKRRLQVMAQSR